ncbi:response regulator [Clostridium niameyense]|uniref:Stage 0 sporulation protein A homolog n=1 Tax=Clostridium niameyense TaxID=1622073 RepID=A0A6M0R7X5_9CLOT|nr:response regulator [Clostridium niameyense]NEZ46336.1 response regulator [Clostridium niameyense]
MGIGKKNILLIDDVASVRSFIKTILEEKNYKVYEACDGQEGIEEYKKIGNIDLIITDIYMPRKSGLELIVELGREYSDVKTIVLTDGGKDNFLNESGVCEALGASYFIRKEMVKNKLIQLVEKVLS